MFISARTLLKITDSPWLNFPLLMEPFSSVLEQNGFKDEMLETARLIRGLYPEVSWEWWGVFYSSKEQHSES